MQSFLTAFNAWLDRTFIGPRGYTVYADGHMERGVQTQGDPAKVTLASFRKVFGAEAELEGSDFLVPVVQTVETPSGQDTRSHGYMRGTFKRSGGQLTATAEFGSTRRSLRLATAFVWTCLLLILLDLLSGTISYATGTLTGNDVMVIVLSVVSLGLLMFAPRVAAGIAGKVFHDLRAPLIAKLSALVQHEGNQ